MSATLKGRAAVWSIGGIAFTAGIISANTPEFPQSLRFNRTSNKTNLVDDGGTIRGQVFHGFMKTMTITVIPCDAAQSLAGARSSMEAHLPQPGTKITITDASGPSDAMIDGSYNLINATQNRGITDYGSVDLELEQSDEGLDLTAAVA